MLDHFRNPPPEYRLNPFWFWNSRLAAAELERQVHEMHSKGIGGFFIHGRFGLRDEYMGEHWMRCIEVVCELARELGMHVYLYDENPFPSGVAGGEAMKDVQHFNKFLDIVRRSAQPGETVRVELPQGQLVCAVAVSEDDPTRSISLINCVQDSTLIWQAPEGRWEVLAFVANIALCEQFIYGSEPDYFEQSLVDKFFEFTHQRYAERLGPYFGEVIRGIFTDEPKIQCIHHMHDDPNTTAWFADLPEQFAADHGYGLMEHLACLARDAGPPTGRVRRDFWKTVTRCYIERFFTPYREWCRENGIALTGHLFLEEGLYANTIYQGNFPQVLAEFDVPGVDHLALAAEGEYAIPQIPPSITRTHGQKLGSSVAHLHGKSRVLSETFGCAGWTLSMERMKWIFDWQASLGINFLCPHAFYYSLAGVRKTDAPPSQFYQATYWPHYRLFADYAARVCYLLSQGTHRAQVALLYPISGFHSEWAPGAEGPLDGMIAGYFDTYCAHLLREHIDYDILTEQDLAGALSVDQELRIAGESYETLILPPTTAISRDAALKIAEFVEDGGRVVCTMLLPTEDSDGRADDEVRDIFHRLCGVDPIDTRRAALRGDLPNEVKVDSADSTVFFITAPEPKALAGGLRDTLSEAVRPEVSVRWQGTECADITFVHRVIGENEVFFFSNNCAEPREVQMSIRCEGAPCAFNLETGSLTALANCTQQGSRTVLLHRFERYGSLAVYFANEPSLCVAPFESEQPLEVALSDEWQFSVTGPNSLTLGCWELSIQTAQDFVRYTYRATFAADFVPEDLALVLDDMPLVNVDAGSAGSKCSVSVNGQPAENSSASPLDVGFQSLPIAGLCNTGTNEIAIQIDHGGWCGDPQLMVAECRLMGSFALAEDSFTLTAPARSINSGSWTDSGYPFYSGTGSYCQSVEIPDFLRDERVHLEALEPADMVEFVINGASAGVRAWAPFEVDITPLVKPGNNSIEIRVTNSLANLLLSEPRRSGLIGGARMRIQ